MAYNLCHSIFQRKDKMLEKPIPIILIAGYLGAGKTTLLNRILQNQKGYKIAVIVNDVGEINIDAELLIQNSVSRGQADNIVALTNGCICCSMKDSFVSQVASLILSEKYDYIVIEASGISEPSSIVNAISQLDGTASDSPYPEIARLDNIVSVVDARRLADDYGCGERLMEFNQSSFMQGNKKPENITSLIVKQIEFCSTLLLNKISAVTEEEKAKLIEIIRQLQTDAVLIEADYADVDLTEILDTHRYDMEKIRQSMGWNKLFQDKNPVMRKTGAKRHQNRIATPVTYSNAENADIYLNNGKKRSAYGVESFVYYRRNPFNKEKLLQWLHQKYPENVIRMKGIVWFQEEPYFTQVLEQAGSLIELEIIGIWTAAEWEPGDPLSPEEEEIWDEQYGDRINKIVFIGFNLDREEIEQQLDSCLDGKIL